MKEKRQDVQEEGGEESNNPGHAQWPGGLVGFHCAGRL